MALKKTAGSEADGATAKKTAAKGSTAKKAAPKKAAVRDRDRKKAAPKKAAGPKLSPPQTELLEKVAGITDPAGYHAEKKPENKSLETLLKHKLVKKGKKHPRAALPLLDLEGGQEAPETLDARPQEQLIPADSQAQPIASAAVVPIHMASPPIGRLPRPARSHRHASLRIPRWPRRFVLSSRRPGPRCGARPAAEPTHGFLYDVK